MIYEPLNHNSFLINKIKPSILDQPSNGLSIKIRVVLEVESFQHLNKRSISERFIGSHVEIAEEMPNGQEGRIIGIIFCKVEFC